MGNNRHEVVNHNYTRKSYNTKGYNTFMEFYPFYLGEHCHKTNRRLHLVGTTVSFLLFLGMIITGSSKLGLAALIQGYGLAWIGHFFFEKNRPATFKHPFYSFMGDIRMWFEVITGLREF